MRKKYNHYSEEFKISVIRDYYSSGMNKYACVKKYQLSCSSVLRSWLLKYQEKVKPLSLSEKPIPETEMSNRSKEDYLVENDRLAKRVKELEAALEFSRLETKVRDMMIDKAEEYFDINIRKKSGAK